MTEKELIEDLEEADHTRDEVSGFGYVFLILFVVMFFSALASLLNYGR